MATTIDIVNQALQMSGSRAINGLEDDSERARMMKVFLPMSTKSCLRDIPWQFARKYKRLTVSPYGFYISDFEFVARKPVDCIRALQIYMPWEIVGLNGAYGGNQQPFMKRWKVVGNYIGIGMEEADLVYTSDVPPDSFDDLAAEYLSALLAMKAAIPLRSSIEIRDALVAQMRTMRKEATQANGLEGLRDKFVAPMRLTAVRRARSGVIGAG